MIFRLPAVK